MKKKKEQILMILMVGIFIGAITMISYAAFNYSRQGEQINTINTGVLSMSYIESSNIISMDKALPTTDATGMVRLKEGEYFDFTVSSTIVGNAMINWEIAAEDFASNTFSGDNIRLYLTKINGDGTESEVMAPKNFKKKTTANEKTGRPANMMSLAVGTMSASEVTNYRLRMYVDEDYNPQGDGGGLVFKVRINVYGKIAEAPTGSKLKVTYMTMDDLENENLPETDFHTTAYSDSVTSIVTKSDNIVPSDGSVIESWDLSEAGDGSVMAYVQDDGSGNGTHKVTIGGKDGIIANESMIGYFSYFHNMTSIDLSSLNTSEVTNMMYMFHYCSNLTNLDLSNFDTSKVTNMGNMFYNCGDLTNLDVSSFDTSQVIDMGKMFRGCSGLTNLDVSNFDTSQVIDMETMFYSCYSLTNLDVSNFDTSQVITMSNMFDSCFNLTNLDVSNFDTSQVTNMAGMFVFCHGLTSLDLSSFDTSQVTSMESMFSGCSSLTNLDLSNFDTSKVTNMDCMFQDCSSLTNLDVSSFDTSQVTDMLNMFQDCSSLTNLDVSSFDTSQVTNMRNMFQNCSSLTEIKASRDKWVIGSSTNTTKMFNGCGVSDVTYI